MGKDDFAFLVILPSRSKLCQSSKRQCGFVSPHATCCFWVVFFLSSFSLLVCLCLSQSAPVCSCDVLFFGLLFVCSFVLVLCLLFLFFVCCSCSLFVLCLLFLFFCLFFYSLFVVLVLCSYCLVVCSVPQTAAGRNTTSMG